MPATITTNVTISQAPGLSSAVGPLVATVAGPTVSETEVTLPAGDTVIAVPAGPVKIIIEPPAGNAVGLKLGNVAATAGVAPASALPLDPVNANVLMLMIAAPGSLYLNAASLTTGLTTITVISGS